MEVDHMKDRMLDIEQRVKRYWYSDGIVEIAAGGVFFILGSFFGVQGYFGEGSTVGWILQVSMVVVMIGCVFGMQWLVNSFKLRLTYPRTGYAENRAKEKESRQRRLLIISVGFVIIVASIVSVGFFREVDLMVFISSVLVGIIFIFLHGRSSGLVRFYYFGALSFFLGIVLSFNDLTRLYNLGLFYGLIGSSLLVSGMFALRKYLDDNPMPLGDKDE